MEFHNLVRHYRQLNNMTQKELADKCDISREYLSRIENHTTSDISLCLAYRLCIALKATFNELFWYI